MMQENEQVAGRKRRSLIECHLESNLNEKMIRVEPGINGTRKTRSFNSPGYVARRKRKATEHVPSVPAVASMPGEKSRENQFHEDYSRRLTVPVKISPHNYFPKGVPLARLYIERSRKIVNDSMQKSYETSSVDRHSSTVVSHNNSPRAVVVSPCPIDIHAELLSSTMFEPESNQLSGDIVDLTNDSDEEDSTRQSFGLNEWPVNTIEQCGLNMNDDNISDDVEIVEMESSLEHPIGTIVWARLSIYPFWPAVVYPHEEATENHIHVKFLADNGRVCFLSSDRILPFKGLAEFREYEKTVKVSNKVHKRMFMVKNKKWDMAVEEANLLQQIDMAERILFHDHVLFVASNMKISQLESAVSVTTAVSRCSSTPCTIDTAYSSMKQSPVAHVDDYPMNDINGNTDDLNVSMIESDALSTVTVKSTSSMSSSRESTTILGFDEYKTTAADRYLANIKRISEQVAREHSCSPFHAVHSHQFKDAVEQFCKLKEASTTKTKSVKPKVDPSPEVKRVATKRRAENEPDTAPTAKRERRFTSFSSSNRSFAASPLPPPLPPIDAEEVARQAKEKIERDRVRQEKLRQRIDDCIIKKYSSSHLFRGCAKGPVCSVCNKADNVARCSGSCALWFHGRCAGDEQVAEPKVRLITGEGAVYDKEAPQVITCQNCRAGVAVQALCFACNEPADPANALIRCVEKHCNKNYHQKCLKLWPQGKFNPTSGAFSCPYHVCQTCESNDVHSNNNHETDRHLIKCISCPASYHRISACIPAGSKLLSDASMICPRHRVYKKKPVNANWCFFCGKTGELVCCETCPATYHNNCLQELNLDPGELYVCEYCESGRLPLYGEIVWAKYSFYKWWPAIIVPPWQIPPNVMRLAQTNYFCICFFGKGKEYAWMCKDTVYRYEDGDSEFENAHALKDNNYRQAVMEAKEFYKIIEATPAVYKIPKKSQTKPNQFRRIKFNKPIAPVRFDNLETSDTECKCRATDEHPCSQFSDCLNHHTFTECQSTCNAGDKCENQRFEKCLYPKLEVRKVGGKGFGLFAGADIECGTFIIEYVGEVINLDEFHRRFERLKQQKSDTYYILSIDGSLFIDAGPKGNDARFINHSCEPNADPQKWTILGVTRIGFFANRDIKTGDEITFDYDWCKIPGKNDVALTPCCCGSKNCAGYIGAKK